MSIVDSDTAAFLPQEWKDENVFFTCRTCHRSVQKSRAFFFGGNAYCCVEHMMDFEGMMTFTEEDDEIDPPF